MNVLHPKVLRALATQHDTSRTAVTLKMNKMSTVMRTIICNSLQSFWDMADNQFLEGLDVHCVFPVNDAIRDFILAYQQQYKIRSVSFTNAFTQN